MAGKPKRGLRFTPFLTEAGPARSIRVYRNKEVIYLQGSPADAVFYLQSGMVKLTVATEHRGKKAVLAVLEEGDFFGEGCLGRERHRVSTAISMGSSTVTRLGKNVFRQKIDRDPAFAAMFMTYLLSQTARFKANLADHFLNSSERRLARILLMYRGFLQKSKKGPFTLRLSQTTLAEMVGTTRARVSTFMNEFRKKGYVRYNGGLRIDSERLTAFLQG
jgi:CRP/FNR family cyclic AMP-dependent transcriptional regulator